MTLPSEGPVSSVDAADVLAQLQALADRSAEHGQSTFQFVFMLTAQSLSDNLEMASGFDDSDG